jgi:pilus assembly protein Flp/PilA
LYFFFNENALKWAVENCDEGWDQIVTREKSMRFIGHAVYRAIGDESGGEVLEYALIAGLIVVAAIGVIGKIGTKVLARWGSLNSSL